MIREIRPSESFGLPSLFLLLVFAVSRLLDMVTTFYILYIMGGYEMNPVVSHILTYSHPVESATIGSDGFTPFLFILCNGAAIVFFGLILYLLAQYHGRAVHAFVLGVLVILVILSLIISVNNLLIIAGI